MKLQPHKPVARFIACTRVCLGLSLKTSTPCATRQGGLYSPLLFIPRWCGGIGKHGICREGFLIHCSDISTSAWRENSRLILNHSINFVSKRVAGKTIQFLREEENYCGHVKHRKQTTEGKPIQDMSVFLVKPWQDAMVCVRHLKLFSLKSLGFSLWPWGCNFNTVAPSLTL